MSRKKDKESIYHTIAAALDDGHTIRGKRVQQMMPSRWAYEQLGRDVRSSRFKKITGVSAEIVYDPTRGKNKGALTLRKKQE